jgi:glycyl-tRNA synthetase beta chain
MEATLLVELLTEELPPKSLRLLSEAFASGLLADLSKAGLHSGSAASAYATPRRIAAQIAGVLERSRDVEREIQGPSVKAPPEAVAGFARKSGVAVQALATRATPKGEVYVARVTVKGATLDELLARLVEDALKRLPIAKLMRWGDGEAQFVRPVHGLVLMHGTRVVPGKVLGLESGNRTRGHRFLGAREIVLASADEYARRLAEEGRVIADFAARRDEIEGELQAAAKRGGATLGEYRELLDEVTALVELPTVYAGRFDPKFLEVPQECLILTMRQNQKYFPLFGEGGRLLPKFLIVSNMRIPDPRHIVAGNERVVRPRLEDARFFYDQDRRVRLETRVPDLGRVVYHNKLGSQLERVERLQLLAGEIARRIGADPSLAERAAWLAKADLSTGMVGEFPELQGVMGAYYARHDGEAAPVVQAIRDQYRTKIAPGEAPESLVSASLYAADRIESLVGMFAIGNAPTGEKDPFGMRRAALGVISVYELLAASVRIRDAQVPEVRGILRFAATLFPGGLVTDGVVDEVFDFMLERYRNALVAVHSRDAVDAVISQRPHLAEVIDRVRAVEEFRKLPEAESLAAANKRIRNILLKSPPSGGRPFSESLFAERAERDLYQAFRALESRTKADLETGRFTDALHALAALKEPVDAFFDKVMVNVDDQALRDNRLLLLEQLNAALNRVADLSRLAA